MTKRWFVVATEPNMDVRFAHDLGNRGYETFIAITFKRMKAGNRAWPEPRLRLSPYVWVAIDDSRIEPDTKRRQNFVTIRQTFGFSHAIALRLSPDGDLNPSEIPECVVEGLRQDLIEDFWKATHRTRRKKSESLYQVGEIVAVGPDHPFHGYQGPISEVRTNGVMAELGPMHLPVRLYDTDIIPVKPFVGRTAA
jgi:hypothetical protein